MSKINVKEIKAMLSEIIPNLIKKYAKKAEKKGEKKGKKKGEKKGKEEILNIMNDFLKNGHSLDDMKRFISRELANLNTKKKQLKSTN